MTLASRPPEFKWGHGIRVVMFWHLTVFTCTALQCQTESMVVGSNSIQHAM